MTWSVSVCQGVCLWQIVSVQTLSIVTRNACSFGQSLWGARYTVLAEEEVQQAYRCKLPGYVCRVIYYCISYTVYTSLLSLLTIS